MRLIRRDEREIEHGNRRNVVHKIGTNFDDAFQPLMSVSEDLVSIERSKMLIDGLFFGNE